MCFLMTREEQLQQLVFAKIKHHINTGPSPAEITIEVCLLLEL